MYPTFFNEVKNGSSVDLKNQKPFKDKNLFIYNGEIVDQDALGNILYGYLGKDYGIPDLVLLMGAGYAQLKAGTWDWHWGSTFFDDPRDAKRVKQGIEIYKKFHEN